MKKYIKVTIINDGGEYTGGIITDKDMKGNLVERMKNNSVNTSMEFDDETEFECHNYINILHNYAPNISDSTILLEETFDIDKDEFDREYNEISSENIYDTEIHNFISSTPFLYQNERVKYSEDDLLFFSQKIEKRIHYPVVIEYDKEEKFELSNVYIGSMSMENAIGDDEIVQYFLYIPKNKAIEYTKELLKEEYNDDSELDEFIEEIFSENEYSSIKEKIINNHLISPEDVEGKGEWENDCVKITTLNYELLFEDGIY